MKLQITFDQGKFKAYINNTLYKIFESKQDMLAEIKNTIAVFDAGAEIKLNSEDN